MDNLPVNFIIRRPICCLVCGAPTNCCHYNVPSCSACRLFFRRTFISGRTFGCIKNNIGTCSVIGKGYCRQCRFDRCIRVGMNPGCLKLTKSCNAKMIFQHLESRKRDIVAPTDEISLPSLPSSPDDSIKLSSIKLPQPMEYRDVDFLLQLELKVRKLRESSYNSSNWYTSRLKELIANQSILGSCDRHHDSAPVSKDIYAKPNIGNNNDTIVMRWFVIDLILSIDMAKVLPTFQRLNPVDKDAFITNGIVPIAILTKIYYSHEKHCEVITYPDGFTPLFWLHRYQQREITKLETDIFIRCLQPIKRIDLTKEEYTLLKVLIFCNPTSKNVTKNGQQLLKQEFERYSRILLRYVQSIHGDARGASRYAQVISIMEAVCYFTEKHLEFYLLRHLQVFEEAKRQNQKFQPLYIIDDLCFGK